MRTRRTSQIFGNDGGRRNHKARRVVDGERTLRSQPVSRPRPSGPAPRALLMTGPALVRKVGRNRGLQRPYRVAEGRVRGGAEAMGQVRSRVARSGIRRAGRDAIEKQRNDCKARKGRHKAPGYAVCRSPRSSRTTPQALEPKPPIIKSGGRKARMRQIESRAVSLIEAACQERHLVALGGRNPRQMPADEAGPACDPDLHGSLRSRLAPRL
jgi:hypothetical protein